VGVEVTRDVVSHLMDGIEKEVLEQARLSASTVAGERLAAVRGRWSGRSLTFEVEIHVPPDSTAAELATVSDQIRESILGDIEAARNVLVIPIVAAGRLHAQVET
jgi:divalent metal cation (Fe/Co/Zn/Cd) transporter